MSVFCRFRCLGGPTQFFLDSAPIVSIDLKGCLADVFLCESVFSNRL